MTTHSSLRQTRPVAGPSASARPPAAPAARPGDPYLAEVERWMAATLVRGSDGLLADIVDDHLASGGKRLRARMVLDAVTALGRPRGEAVPFAAACELLHNATLIHDDLQDGDTVRRGRPTVWAAHGAVQAINAGDLLLMLPMLALESPRYAPDLRWYLTIALASRSTRTACGQADEQLLLPDGDLSVESQERIAAGKTGQFFALPLEGAALIAGLDPATARRVGDAVVPLGVLFQMQDDLVDLYGDKGRGEIGCDLREGKVSALVTTHVAAHPETADALLAVLRAPREQTRDADVMMWRSRFLADGTVQRVLDRMHELEAMITHDPVLAAVPSLHDYVREITARLLAPVNHLELSSASA